MFEKMELPECLCHLNHLSALAGVLVIQLPLRTFKAWMAERLFSSIKKLSSCENSVGEN